MKKILLKGFIKLNLSVSPYQIDLFQQFFDFYQESQKKFNLSSLLSAEDFAIKHVLDCATALSFFKNEDFIADIGSGGGFPGVVLKILNPQLKIDLIEVVEKKVVYLKELTQLLKLDIKVFNASKEKVPPLYNVVTCRAFGSLEKIRKQAKKILVKGGVVLAYKGKEKVVKKEIMPAFLSKTQIYPLKVPFLEAERTLVEVKK